MFLNEIFAFNLGEEQSNGYIDDSIFGLSLHRCDYNEFIIIITVCCASKQNFYSHLKE